MELSALTKTIYGKMYVDPQKLIVKPDGIYVDTIAGEAKAGEVGTDEQGTYIIDLTIENE